MCMIYYFFLKRTLTGEKRETPFCSTTFIGDIGDFIQIDGIGYQITDFAVEPIAAVIE